MVCFKDLHLQKKDLNREREASADPAGNSETGTCRCSFPEARGFSCESVTGYRLPRGGL